MATSKERSILYSAPMVRAYFDDDKRQTRRIIKPEWWRCLDSEDEEDRARALTMCPYGQPGDLMRGKEAAWIWCRKEREGNTQTGRPKFNYIPVGRHVIYQVNERERPAHRIDSDPNNGWRLKIGRYLPGWASRMLAEIVSVRIERVQDISDQDAEQEGVMHWAAAHVGLLQAARIAVPDRPRFFYKMLWVQINGQASWDSNDWVWVLTFKRRESTTQKSVQ